MRALLLIATLTATLALCACRSPFPPQVDAPGLWTHEFTPPPVYETERVRLEPLGPHHAELDHAAFMGSREHLRRTLHWGSWPADDTTLEQNRSDLQRHWDELQRREGYAYTVLNLDGTRCVGCLYLNPLKEDPPPARQARFAYWVVEDALADDLDAHLLDAVLDWYEDAWPVDRIVVLPHVGDERGIRLLEEAGLEEVEDESEDRRTFVWER